MLVLETKQTKYHFTTNISACLYFEAYHFVSYCGGREKRGSYNFLFGICCLISHYEKGDTD